MQQMDGTSRDFEPSVFRLLSLPENVGQAQCWSPATVDQPLAGTLPIWSIEQEMLEGYYKCASLELEILSDFEAVDRENF